MKTGKLYNTEILTNVWADNRKRLILLSLFVAAAMAVMFGCSFFVESLEKNRFIYTVMFVVCSYICFTSKFSKNRYMQIATMYLFVFAMFIFGLLLGTVIEPNETSVSFPIILFAIPLCFTENPIRMNIAVLAGMIAYCFAAFATQEPHMVQYNLTNVIPYGILSMILCTMMMKMKFDRYELQYNYEESVAEQEEQINEINELNRNLEEKQGQLEEISSEQEAQLKEIEELNIRLQERQNYTDTLYRQLLKVQACGIVAYGLPDHNVLIMNDMAREMYGLPIDEKISDEEVISKISKARFDNPEETRAHLKSLSEPGDRHSFSFWLDKADGNSIHVFTTTQLIQMNNGDMVIVSSLLDITDITNMERITAQANAANSAKTTFLFNMSHDIRTPMNAIIGYTELMEKNIDNPEKSMGYLRKIKDSSDILLSLINNVLEMARIESGKAVLDEEVVSATQLSDEISSVYEELMKSKGITYTHFTDVKTEYIYGDKVKLNEIFLNLISNAYKYTPYGGTVSEKTVELPCEKEGWIYIQTTVSDTGIGMSSEYLPKLFEEFSRAQNTTDAKIEGTGLGMPIVKKLVDLMGGTITVESELGKGTTFVVTIPHRIADLSEKQNEYSEQINTKAFAGKHILLAEDNDLNAEIAIEILSEYGILVDRAEDGIICVDMLTKADAGTYDLILMDIQMPNMDGYKATEKIRRLPDIEKANIPIVAMTANAFEEDRQNAFKAGMNGHLAKPIDISRMISTLNDILKVQDDFTSFDNKESRELPSHIKKIILDMQRSSTVAALPGGLFVYEAKFPERLIYANRNAHLLWGCESFEELYELSGGSFKGLVHPDDYERIERDIWNQIDTGSQDTDQVKYRIIKKDGSVGRVNDYGRLIRDDINGDVFYVFVSEETN